MPEVLTPENAHKFAGLTVRPIGTVANDGLFIMLYGKGGIGKTTLASSIYTSPHAGKVLHVDIEGGGSSIAHIENNVDSVSITKWSELDGLKRVVESGQDEYGTIIVDNLSEAQNMSIASIAGSEQPQIQHWGKCTADMLRLIRAFRNAARNHGTNVVLIAWEEREPDAETQKWMQHIFFTPKLAQQAPGIITLIGLITVLENPPLYTRKLTFAPSNKTDAKFRVAPNESAAGIPLDIYWKATDPVLADMLAVIRDGAKWPASKYGPPGPVRPAQTR